MLFCVFFSANAVFSKLYSEATSMGVDVPVIKLELHEKSDNPYPSCICILF